MFPPAPRSRTAGFTLLDLLVVLALATLAALLTVPPLVRAAGKARVGLAAAEVLGSLRQARQLAVARSAHVALRFERDGGGRIGFALYRDGDDDGVRRDDIDDGTDPLLQPWHPLSHLGRGAGFGFPPGPPPRDPADPSRRLDRRDDPIRFNRSDLASFGPLGESTPGSVYLTDGVRHLAAVRVFGRTARARVLWYDAETERWR